MAAINKRLLISESRSDSNRCTPCRGKPDNTPHASYAQSIYGLRPYVSHVVHISQPFVKSSTELSRATALEIKGSWHNPQHTSWPILGSIPSFSLEPTNEAVGAKPSICWRRLLGLPGPYHRHAIGTFNTCSRGPTHQSLTNTGKGYNLGGVGLPHTTPRLSQPAVSTFP
jgi:hypothetical protein